MNTERPRVAAAPLIAAARLLAERGVYGLAWFDNDFKVTATYGALAGFVEIGERLMGSVPPLHGLEDDIRALKEVPGMALNLPAVSIVTDTGAAPKLNLLVLWSSAQNAFLLAVSRAVSKADLEIELSRQIRARLITEAELRQKSAELSRANRDLEEYAAIISHDLKAPLRAMRYLIDELESQLGSGRPHPAEQIAGRLREQSLRMSGMLTALLEYSSIGRKDEGQSTVDTLQMVKSILKSMSHPPAMRIELHGEWPHIETFEALLDLVLRNLIGNAISHHDRDTGLIRVVAINGQNDLEITVADDGPGILPQHHEAIFLPFRTLRADGSSGGHGMGLSFVKRTIETIRGRIEVDSDPGQKRGTSFRVVWPKCIKPDG